MKAQEPLSVKVVKFVASVFAISVAAILLLARILVAFIKAITNLLS